MAKLVSHFERTTGFRFYALLFCLVLSFSIWPSLKTLLPPTSSVKSQAFDTKREVLLCQKLSGEGDYCEIEGDIRIQPNTSTVFVVLTHKDDDDEIMLNSWTVKPYVRGIATNVKNWTIKTVSHTDNMLINCTVNHNNPAVLFSAGGNYGNYYHSFSDLLSPLYMTSYSFQQDVDFLASDYHDWWINKFRSVLSKLSRHPVVDIDNESGQVHCYRKMVVGLKFYSDLIVDEDATRVSIHGFRQLLRDSYSLKRKRSMESGRTSPRLMIVSRKRTRVLLNEDEIVRVAKGIGFKVILAKEEEAANMSRFTHIVNSCDVIMGIHGAGLANLLFLPDKAVVIQLVPFGQLSYIARNYFSAPVSKMKLRYLEYEVSTEESSLSKTYPADDPVLKDPPSIHMKGWEMIDSVYLQNQNITVDVGRFKDTLVKAMNLLVHH